MGSRPRFPRRGCAVPGCRRTSELFRNEWLCADHWRLVDRSLKTYRTRHLRKLSRAGYATRWRRAENLIWRRMKRQAIERAAGL